MGFFFADIFGGNLIGVRSSAGLSFYDWENTELIRRIEIQPKSVRKCHHPLRLQDESIKVSAILFSFTDVVSGLTCVDNLFKIENTHGSGTGSREVYQQFLDLTWQTKELLCNW